LYFGSYKKPRELLWIIGVVIFFMMMATAFLGYTLPWGQMSFWGATVITNLFSAIPIVGESIVTWLWGGYSVSGTTLNRFFALHYLLPFVLFGVVVLHIWALHVAGQNNPTGLDIKTKADAVPMFPFAVAKDAVGLFAFLIMFAWFVFFLPDYLGHADNYIEANPLVTPPHIVPEWYFLPFYAILRAITFDILWVIPAKLGGVICMFGSIFVMALAPWTDTSRVRSGRYRPMFKWWFWLLVLDFVVLTWAGGQPPEGLVPVISLIGTIYWFAYFLVILPVLGFAEKPEPRPETIEAAVEQSHQKHVPAE
jgi:ubiquinol-cytochrome c reductase cytochrome b subunit